MFYQSVAVWRADTVRAAMTTSLPLHWVWNFHKHLQCRNTHNKIQYIKHIIKISWTTNVIKSTQNITYCRLHNILRSLLLVSKSSREFGDSQSERKKSKDLLNTWWLLLDKLLLLPTTTFHFHFFTLVWGYIYWYILSDYLYEDNKTDPKRRNNFHLKTDHWMNCLNLYFIFWELLWVCSICKYI